MKFKKLVKANNIGRFQNLHASGDVEFGRLTLVYGDNGSGKTTLASLLRSLTSGDAAFIDERTTLGTTGGASAQVLLADGQATYSSGAWDRNLPDLEIFDSTFVGDNVYTGDRVDVEHRKNLYEVVVGATAVALAKRIDALNTSGKTLAREIKSKEQAISEKMQAPFALKDFLSLEPEDDLDKKIADRTTQLNATRQAAKVVARKQLEPLPPPASPRPLAKVLGKHAEALSKEVEERVRKHIRDQLDSSGESWLRQGVAYAEGGDCPFCGQDLTGSDLVHLYREFFSEAYREHVIEIRQALNALRQRYSDDELSKLERLVSENGARIRAWEDLANLSGAATSLDELSGSWRAMRTQLENALQRKLEDPGSVAPEADQTEATIRDLEQAIAKFEAFNAAIANANAAITELKKQSASADPAKIEAELRLLRNKQIRQEPEVVKLCDELSRLQAKKRDQSAEKEDVRQQLEKQAGTLLAEHEDEINRLLSGFGANFRITGTKPVFPGGSASSTYQLQINGIDLALGDARTPRGTPCFKTALSAGDKSTLALAFFLAKLRRDTSLGSKIVVFDDPLSSLDSFRISFTQHELARVAERAEQTIVLSHDPFFLQGIAAADCCPTAKPLRIARKGQTHTLQPWEIDKQCMPQAHKDYFILCRFADDGLPDGGDLVTVARSIRPYVESYLRLKFPDRFPPGKMLGWFIKTVRESSPGDELKALEPQLPELEDLNGFARKFPHDNPGQTTDAEVEAYIRKAFGLVRG